MGEKTCGGIPTVPDKPQRINPECSLTRPNSHGYRWCLWWLMSERIHQRVVTLFTSAVHMCTHILTMLIQSHPQQSGGMETKALSNPLIIYYYRPVFEEPSIKLRTIGLWECSVNTYPPGITKHGIIYVMIIYVKS